jgi:hypothetical protein
MKDFPSFKQFLEARKNPELNPKISTYEALKKYKNDPDIYISFTEIQKIGINPNSSYDSPLGIYTYPLKEIWEFYKIQLKQKFKGVLPFAARQPHIWVLRNTSPNFLEDMYQYKNSQYEKDLETLSAIIKRIVEEDKKSVMKSFIKMVRSFPSIPQQVESFIDNNISILEEGILDTLKSKLFKSNNRFDMQLSDMIQRMSIANRFEKNSVSAFYSATKMIAMMLANSTKDRHKISVKWNWVMRQCGYSGIADKSGMGIIYRTEPIQAVFFSTDVFEVVEMVYNKDHGSEDVHQ